MSEYAEVRAILFRWAVKLDSFVGPRELDYLFEWCGGWILERSSAHAKTGSYDRREDGGARVTYPSRLGERELLQVRVHELAHACLDLPPGEQPSVAIRDLPKCMAEQIVRANETECHVFADALRLPRRLVRRYLSGHYPDWDGLIEDSGCTAEEILRRVEWMKAHAAPQLLEPPPWAAWHHYRVLLQESAFRSAWLIEPHDEGPEIIIPFRGSQERRVLARMVQGSLAALRPHEFHLKFGPDQVGYRECFWPWDEWREDASGAWELD